jgi:hypothetical protein
MKKIILNLFILLISVNTFCQTVNGDFSVSLPIINPAPVVVNGTSDLNFSLSYLGTDLMDLGKIANDPLVTIITLSNVEPNNSDPLAAITITGEGNNLVTYDVSTKSYTLIQTSEITDLGGFSVSINVKHTIASTPSLPQNGLSISTSIPLYINDADGADKNNYTYTLSVLPVNISKFEIVENNCNSKLNWVTTKEENFNHFDVEYSNDGIQFTKIGLINSNKATSGSSYTFSTIQKNYKGYYRLKIVDENASYSYTEILKFVSKCNTPKISIYPNPVVTGGATTLNIEHFGNKIIGNITDFSGKILTNLVLTNGRNILKINNLAAGTYLLKVSDEFGNKNIMKIVLLNK